MLTPFVKSKEMSMLLCVKINVCKHRYSCALYLLLDKVATMEKLKNQKPVYLKKNNNIYHNHKKKGSQKCLRYYQLNTFF